ncbi:hypothetical protein F4810DRAFT_705126 [Camillea tinctor]|nr:hypothetical protein F4810DRAFT_705126 [Camillea tinctor]
MPIIHKKPQQWHQRRCLNSKAPNKTLLSPEKGNSKLSTSVNNQATELREHELESTPSLSEAACRNDSPLAGTPDIADLDVQSISESEVESFSESDSDLGSNSDTDSDIDSGYASAETPQFYHEFITECEEQGPTMANRGESAKNMIRVEEKRWFQFCQFMNWDPDESLIKCQASIFKAYLLWRCKNSRIKKESSIITYWKVLSMFYCDKTATWVDGLVLYDIGNWIPVALTPLFGLDTSMKNKSGLYVFPHERLRVQLAAALVLAGATSTRPGALIENLRYKDVEFHIFPPAATGGRARVGMVVKLTKMKRSAGISKPRKYGFHEEDTLLHDPVLYMESLAFADGAFSTEFHGLKDIYRLVIPRQNNRMVLPWKPEWQERYVFRDTQNLDGSILVNLDKAFQYGKARKYLIRLGRALGFEKQLEWYDLRRASGKKLNRDSSTYVRFYMTDFIEVDFQEIVFGSEPQRDLIHLMGRLLRRGDAPKHLTEQQKAEINLDPKLIKFRQKRGKSKTHCKGLLHKYESYSRQADCRRKKLYDERLSRAIQEFHALADTEEIERQLSGIRPSEYFAPPTVQYQLPERARIAKLFSEAANVSDRSELYMARIRLMEELALLCDRREKPCRRQAKTGYKPAQSHKPTLPMKSSGSASLRPKAAKPLLNPNPTKKMTAQIHDRLTCPFCSCKYDPYDLAKHISGQHSRESTPFRCPYETCPGIIGSAEYLASHFEHRHFLESKTSS